MRLCLYCKGEIVDRSQIAIYCSAECSDLYRDQKEDAGDPPKVWDMPAATTDGQRECKQCGAPLIRKNKSAVYCSIKCRQKFYSNLYSGRNIKHNIPAGSVGAMHELLVAADLLKNGFNVFRAVSPCSPGDLAILREKQLLIVEVTTGTRTSTGALMYPPHTKGTHDIIAIVEYSGKITYIPDCLAVAS